MPGEQIILAPKVEVPLPKKGKAVTRHDCLDTGFMARRDVRECFEQCVVSFVIRIQLDTLLLVEEYDA